MEAEEYFATTYQDAHAKFLSACRDLKLRPRAFRAAGEAKEQSPPLVDCVRLGDPAADRLLVVCGGDRLADALCCSGVEIGWLDAFGKATLPRNTAIVLLHHGAAPASGGEVADEAEPPVWEDDILAKVEQRYAEYARQHGIDASGAPLATAKDGDVPGYPGDVLDGLARALASGERGRIAVVDIRVGLGPYGEAELAPCHPPGSEAARRVRGWFGLAQPGEDEAQTGQQPGYLAAGLRRRLPEAEVTLLSAAFGTYSMQSVLDNLLAGSPGGTPPVRQMIYPESPEWRDAVWHSATIVIQRVLTALHGP